MNGWSDRLSLMVVLMGPAGEGMPRLFYDVAFRPRTKNPPATPIAEGRLQEEPARYYHVFAVLTGGPVQRDQRDPLGW